MGSGPWSVELTQERAGWSWASLRVLDLDVGASLTIESKDEEMLALPLEGSWMVACGDDEFVLEGRESVFSSPTDFSYIGRRLVATLTSNDGGRIALAGAPARRDLPFRYASAGQTAVELRGPGHARVRSTTCACRTVSRQTGSLSAR